MTIYSRTNPPQGFYTYAYIRKDFSSPYYIGKGKNLRAWMTHSAGALPKDKNRIVILEANLTELGALALERRYIRWYGRKDLGTGCLNNRTDGGEGIAGTKFSDEHRRKIAIGKLGNTWNDGVKKTDEHRRKISKSHMGIGHTEKTKERLREISKAQAQNNRVTCLYNRKEYATATFLSLIARGIFP